MECCHSPCQKEKGSQGSMHWLLNLCARSGVGYFCSDSIGQSKNRELPNFKWGRMYAPTTCLEGERARICVDTNGYHKKEPNNNTNTCDCNSDKFYEEKEEDTML